MEKTINTLNIENIEVVVLANGEFPINQIPLSLLQRPIPVGVLRWRDKGFG